MTCSEETGICIKIDVVYAVPLPVIEQYVLIDDFCQIASDHTFLQMALVIKKKKKKRIL